MAPGPSKAAEALVALLIPPACRENVLGDLHERYRSPGQYAADALRTVPLVILSRIRRTADPPVLLMQALALYIAFLGAAWFIDRALVREQWGLSRLALPAATAILGVILEDAYARPGHRSPLRLIRGPAAGIGLALASQAVLWAGSVDLALPPRIALYGCAMSLLLASAVRLSFPPATRQLRGAHAPVHGLKQAGVPEGAARRITLALESALAIVLAVGAGEWIADRFALARPRAIGALLLLLIAYHLWKRG